MALNRWLSVCLLAGAGLVAAGCGYHLVGTSSFLPEELETMYVATFENNTKWADMDQRLTEAVVQEWVRRRRFRMTEQAKGSDLVLRGLISSLRVAPVTFDSQGRATKYQMTLTVHVRLEDVRGDEPEIVWEDKQFSRRTSYDVDVSAVNYFDRQVEAMEDVSREFSRALVTAVLEGF
jgi:outer membrane lipopolysaccharide assembly protein LptE/RlpB